MTSTFSSDAEILKRLRAGEDSFVKRKSVGDWKIDAVKTCVAFANSCPLGGPSAMTHRFIPITQLVSARHSAGKSRKRLRLRRRRTAALVEAKNTPWNSAVRRRFQSVTEWSENKSGNTAWDSEAERRGALTGDDSGQARFLARTFDANQIFS
jgi:hypothetical protein